MNATPAPVLNFAQDELRANPARQNMGAGVNWFKEAWQLFKRHPIMWMLMVWAMLLAIGAIFFTLILSVFTPIILPTVTAGLSCVAHASEKGTAPKFGLLLLPYKTRFTSLLAVGVLQFLLYFSLTLVFIFLLLVGASYHNTPAVDLALSIAGLVFILLHVLILLVFSYTALLVMHHQLHAVVAAKLALRGCVNNALPILVFSVLLLVLTFLTGIPMFLGWFALFPLSFLALYASYKAIFVQG